MQHSLPTDILVGQIALFIPNNNDMSKIIICCLFHSTKKYLKPVIRVMDQFVYFCRKGE